jgi:hypothetical protein
MIGYKGFNADLTCRGFQYIVGHTHYMDPNQLDFCHSGFHFCRYPVDVFNYYNEDHHIYAKIKATGRLLVNYDKCATNEITVLEILTRQQLISLMPNFVERWDGEKQWYQNGQFHRLDGPAREYPNGLKEYYIYGKLCECTLTCFILRLCNNCNLKRI